MAVQTWQYFRDLLINGYIPVGQDYTDLVDTIDSFDVSMVDNGDGTYTFTDSDGSFVVGSGEIEIQDINGVSQGTTSLLQMGENITYNSATKELSALPNFYEEGVFTPDMDGNGGYPVVSSSGVFNRIGNLVNCNFTIDYSSYDPFSAVFRIELPIFCEKVISVNIIKLTGTSLTPQEIGGLSFLALSDGEIVLVSRDNDNSSNIQPYFDVKFPNGGTFTLGLSYITNIYSN